jgi:hypothetical protein
MTDRLSCCIPGCRRTFKREPSYTDDTIVMCGRHWRMGDLRMRDRHKQLRKRIRWIERQWLKRNKVIEQSGRYVKYNHMLHRAYMAAHHLWHRVREDVTIKAAFGAEDAPRRRPRVDA